MNNTWLTWTKPEDQKETVRIKKKYDVGLLTSIAMGKKWMTKTLDESSVLPQGKSSKEPHPKTCLRFHYSGLVPYRKL